MGWEEATAAEKEAGSVEVRAAVQAAAWQVVTAVDYALQPEMVSESDNEFRRSTGQGAGLSKRVGLLAVASNVLAVGSLNCSQGRCRTWTAGLLVCPAAAELGEHRQHFRWLLDNLTCCWSTSASSR